MTRDSNDAALRLALRALTLHRAALHHDRHARVTEHALAHWARAHNLPFVTACRSQHPLAKQLRAHLRTATRTRRRRDQLLPTLAATPATSIQAARAKLCVARLFIDDDTPAATLLHSLARDLRHLR
ncbi:MAG: hypothetical protein M0D54_02430 [Hyphomonadaceae bacterium JAD_PAG50586_4]|nr:MAG: hypothetical protein M0D54_02430 [Hyphomonadaceae bacterium JAD_PAG50586_4]